MTRKLHVSAQILAIFAQVALPAWMKAFGIDGSAWDEAVHSTIGFMQGALAIYAHGLLPDGSKAPQLIPQEPPRG